VSTSLRDLDPRVRSFAQAFIRALSRVGIVVAVRSTRRDLDEQRTLWDQYKRCGARSEGSSAKCATAYPAAPPGHSMHALGLAFDLHLEPDAAYEFAGRLWEAAGFTWGGRFHDRVHFDFRRRD